MPIIYLCVGISIGTGIASIIQELRWRLIKKIDKCWDDPQCDATDFAHPAWWRGEEWSCNMFCKMIDKILTVKFRVFFY